MAVPRAVILYKSKVIDDIIAGLRAKLADQSLPEEEQATLTHQISVLNQERTLISKKTFAADRLNDCPAEPGFVPFLLASIRLQKIFAAFFVSLNPEHLKRTMRRLTLLSFAFALLLPLSVFPQKRKKRYTLFWTEFRPT